MNIQELFKLNFREASDYFKGRLKGRISPYANIEKLKETFGLDDSVWEDPSKNLDDDSEDGLWHITKTGPVNSEVYMTNKWQVTNLRVVLKFRYSEDIAICYYLGNTSVDSFTLKEIGVSGVGSNYWEKEYPFLENLGLNPHLSISIPEILYQNGRKGTVSDLVSRRYGEIKTRLDLAIMDIETFMSDGKFVESWNSLKGLGEFNRNVQSDLKGALGNHMASLLVDPSNISLEEVVVFLKSEAYGTYYPLSKAYEYFRDRKGYYYSYYYNGCVPTRSNFDGLSKEASKELKRCKELLDLRATLNTELDSCFCAIENSIENVIEIISDTIGMTPDQLKGFIDLRLTKSLDFVTLEKYFNDK